MLALFGKLPAKRDFVARGVPGAVLQIMEPFLQAAVAEGKEALGPLWTERFLTAPIWRFWWSRDVCGGGIKGVVMPSVDGIGRYFPLAAMALAPEGFDHPVPSAADERWYAALEDALLSALVHEGTLDDLLARLAGVPEPPPPAEPEFSGTLWWTISDRGEGPKKSAWPMLPPHRTFAKMLAGVVPPPAAPPTRETDVPPSAAPPAHETDVSPPAALPAHETAVPQPAALPARETDVPPPAAPPARAKDVPPPSAALPTRETDVPPPAALSARAKDVPPPAATPTLEAEAP